MCVARLVIPVRHVIALKTFDNITTTTRPVANAVVKRRSGGASAAFKYSQQGVSMRKFWTMRCITEDVLCARLVKRKVGARKILRNTSAVVTMFVDT